MVGFGQIPNNRKYKWFHVLEIATQLYLVVAKRLLEYSQNATSFHS